MKSQASIWSTCCFAVLVLSGQCNVQPQRVSATATVSGLDGLSHAVSETFTLTHNVGEADTPRLASRRVVIPQVKDFAVSVTRTGIPIRETFVLLNISQTGFAPGSSAPQPVVSSGDHAYIADHVGNLVSVNVDTDRVDSPLTATLQNVFPARQRTGYVLFARRNNADPCMPFADAAAPIDISRFATTIFNTLSGVVTAADAASNKFSLGGPQNDGNFEMYFVPFSQHSTLSDFGTPRNGFTFIFKASIKAALVNADVYVPLSVLFSRLPGGATGDSLDARLDLLDFGTDSDDMKRVTVAAEGTFQQATADAIRAALLTSIGAIPPATKNTVATALGLFSASVNALRPNQGRGPLPENVRVVLFPGTVQGQPLNRVAPAAVSLQPSLCILQSSP